MQFFEGEQVGGNIFADRGVRAAAGFHRANALGLQRPVLNEEFTVFFRENIVRHSRNAHLLAQSFAELKHQRGFSAADRAADSDSESPHAEIAPQRHVALVEVPRMPKVLVRVAIAVVVIVSVMKKNAHKSGLKKS